MLYDIILTVHLKSSRIFLYRHLQIILHQQDLL
nr:MAG TPA: hypothetical protein [Caudoviricetes sp.]